MTSRSSPRRAFPVATGLVCPCCGGPVARLRTRLIDRVLGRVRGIKRRYRCTIVTCGWKTVEPADPDPALLRAWGSNRRDLRG